jgi:hypothetical protein
LKALCCDGPSTSPVVLRKTTAARPRNRLGVNALAFSVAETEKPFALPRPRIAAMPAGIESCRNPAVLEKTSTWARGLGFASGSLDLAIRLTVAIPTTAAAKAIEPLRGLRIPEL